MFPIHQVVFYKRSPRLSEESKINFIPIVKWFGKELFTYVRVYRSLAPPHVLPLYVPDTLLAREISYQTVGDGLTKTLKEAKNIYGLHSLSNVLYIPYMISSMLLLKLITLHV